ncbi:1-aminocyclopropane-1-carboxylate oxidase-like [Spatholobus suberectus]|nr:1-aminocyclopropane-1-carboxylate oxidase-like [Spatholobus suberectus]
MGVSDNNEVLVTTKVDYDRASELKAFDDTKDGVKGLADARITMIPRIFHRADEDPTRRKVVVEKIREASETWGFFQIVNHGIPVSVLEEMKNGVHSFYEQDSKVKRELYTRDPLRPLVYNSNFDLYSSPAANWRDTFYCYMAPRPPKP